jgi:hypothetical protein
VNLAIVVARLIQGRSDERDKVQLANAARALANQQVNAWPALVTTTDATVTTAWSDTLAPNSIADLWLVAVGLTADGSTAGAYRRRAVFQRTGTGAAALLGTVDVIGIDKETDATWDVTFAALAADTVGATVKGAVGDTVSWRVNITGVVAPWTT